MGKPIDDLRSPSLASLPAQDVPADRPIEQDQLAVDGESGTHLSAANARLQFLKELRIAGWGLEGKFIDFRVA